MSDPNNQMALGFRGLSGEELRKSCETLEYNPSAQSPSLMGGQWQPIETAPRTVEECITIMDRQIAIYDAKIDEALERGNEQKMERMENYKDAVEHLRALIGGER